MDGQQPDPMDEVNGFARGVLIAILITASLVCLTLGGCQAVKANPVNEGGSPRIQTVLVKANCEAKS